MASARILIVEDEAISATSLITALREFGYNAGTYETDNLLPSNAAGNNTSRVRAIFRRTTAKRNKGRLFLGRHRADGGRSVGERRGAACLRPAYAGDRAGEFAGGRRRAERGRRDSGRAKVAGGRADRQPSTDRTQDADGGRGRR